MTHFRLPLYALACIYLCSLNITPLAAQDTIAPTPEEAVNTTPPPRSLTYSDALVLGLVEGVTEYLPVSSTGHLILTNRLLGLDEEIPLPEDPEAPTLKQAADAYAIVIQGGAILAVVLLYWRRLLDILWGVLGKSPNGRLLARNLIAAFMPAAVLGLLLDDLIERYLFNPLSVIIALAAGAILMFAVERRRQHRRADSPKETDDPDLHALSIRQCLMIGFLQCVAMWPGTSRSMMTIVGGYLAGLRPDRAAEFSFLLGLITLTAASGYKLLTGWEALEHSLTLGPALFGIAVATVAAAFSVKWLVGYLSRHGLALFAWYRLALAAVLAAALATDWL